jgi:hypothetical protein
MIQTEGLEEAVLSFFREKRTKPSFFGRRKTPKEASSIWEEGQALLPPPSIQSFSQNRRFG